MVKSNLGIIRLCPQCKQGNVIIRNVATSGPSEVFTWDEDQQRFNWSYTDDDKETFYGLDCGHTVTKTEVDKLETPKFVRWYPQENENVE